MGVEKSELKAAVLQELETELLERWEALGIELYRLEGGRRLLEQLKEAMERDVFARLRKDIDEGKIDSDLVAPQVDRYVRTCIHFVAHMLKGVVQQLPLQQGRIDELEHQRRRFAQKREVEEAKALAVEAAVAEGEVAPDDSGELEEVPVESRGPSRRPTGVRPARPLKGRRQDGDVDARAAVAPVQDGAEAPQAAEESVASKKVPKKAPRKRPSRKKVAAKDAKDTG